VLIALPLPTASSNAEFFPSTAASSHFKPNTIRNLIAAAVALAALMLPQAWSQSDSYSHGFGADQQPGYGQQDSGQGFPQQDPQQNYGQPAQPQPAQPLNAGDLEQLVAPIALYPDALVAQVLAASTYPTQVEQADRWRQMQGNASPDQIAAGADTQNWDPSVKALTAFPQVLAQMERNIQWTTDLGNAYYNQPQDVLEAVQVMRRRAQAAGTLQSTPQEVVREDAGSLELLPVNPQVVYVPAYNPWAVYGEPVSPYPGFALLDAIGSVIGTSLRYGLGIGMGAFMHTPWGWLAWGLNWLTHALMFNHSNYYSHSATIADWGFRHKGFHAYAGRAGFGRLPNSYAHARENESWRRGGYSTNGWHDFARAPDRRADNWRGSDLNNRISRGPELRNGFRNDFRNGFEHRPRESYNPSGNNRIERPSMPRENQPRDYARGGYERAYGGAFEGNGRERTSEAFAGRGFTGHSAKPERSSGHHWFGGSREPKSLGGEKGFRSEKNFGGRSFGGKNFKAPKAPKNFGGKAPRGGGGHSGGHAGKHRH
jgi:hypothetical protein